jgi:hypothetical protein
MHPDKFERRRRARLVIAVLLVGAIVSALVAGVFFMVNNAHPHI